MQPERQTETRQPAPGPATAEIRAFVQGRLGCGCPEAVFESVEATLSGGYSEKQPYGLRLAVGGRLLVYVVRLTELADPAAAVRRMARAGRAERDAGGFNRFRAVLVAADAGQVPVPVLRAFGEVAGADRRCHLHVVDPAACGSLLD